MPKWYESQLYADCQQKLFLWEHDTDARILLVTFLGEQKRELQCTEIIIFDIELVFFVNVHATSLLKCTQSCI